MARTKTFDPLRKRLAELPRTIAASVAKRAAPVFTDLTQTAYSGSVDVYGQPRPKSEVDGAPLDLYREGKAQRSLRFKSDGTSKIRVDLGTPYTKFLVGKYRVLPNGPIPRAWREAFGRLVQQTEPPR